MAKSIEELCKAGDLAISVLKGGGVKPTHSDKAAEVLASVLSNPAKKLSSEG